MVEYYCDGMDKELVGCCYLQGVFLQFDEVRFDYGLKCGLFGFEVVVEVDVVGVFDGVIVQLILVYQCYDDVLMDDVVVVEGVVVYYGQVVGIYVFVVFW